MENKLKAQMFLISAFIIAIALIALKIGLKAPSIDVEISKLKISIKQLIAKNLFEELKNSARFSSKNQIFSNSYEFAKYACKKIDEMGYVCKLISFASIAENDLLNISLVNNFKASYNFTITVWNESYSSSKSKIVTSGEQWLTNFSIASGQSYNVSISFANYNETFLIASEASKASFNGFYDLFVYENSDISRFREKDYFVIE